MASLAELARLHTELDGPRIAHLQRLAAAWGVLADFSFADLLLLAPTRGSEGREFLVLGQIRPTTSQTVYRSDWVGTVLTSDDRPIVARSFEIGELLEGEITVTPMRERVRVLAIPVRWRGVDGSVSGPDGRGETIAVLSKESTPTFGRQPGELERIYVDVFNRFARMIASGEFPFATEDADTDAVPRVGDGVLLLDAQMRVEYASPNGVSALHRIGIHANSEGMRLGELGLDETPIRTAFERPVPVSRELERGPEITVVLRCIPLVVDGVATGAVVLLRDISELRRRDRLLLSKDATIREIHHRVKNNLQTISSLLRLQGRRLASPEAKAAIEESVRRVRSIGFVHEILSREAGEDVPFDDLVHDLGRMAETAFSVAERPFLVVVQGDPGAVPVIVATPLSVVLNELLQNAADHAFRPGEGGGTVTIDMRREAADLVIRVVDDGAGLPAGFDLDAGAGLGLSIVRTLVSSELHGSIEMVGADGGGTAVTLRVPIESRRA